MGYVINLSKNITATVIYRQLEELIVPILNSILLDKDSNQGSDLIINVGSGDSGEYHLSYSLDYSGRYIYMFTKGDNIIDMAEKLIQKLISYFE
jgi:hypothetical protein